jgi:2-amino-4-hydroxy-6-hydroxymethyldihydropteridine diphosphokinase
VSCHRACLSLGSNIAPELHLPQAIERLHAVGRVAAVSRVWQSPAIGAADQPDYCNVAVLLETERSATELIDCDGPLRAIEAALGRVRSPENRHAARTIDIDLTLFDREERCLGRKCVPDPDLFDRSCIAVPLAELPGVELPPSVGMTAAQLATHLGGGPTLSPRLDIDQSIRDALSRSG